MQLDHPSIPCGARQPRPAEILAMEYEIQVRGYKKSKGSSTRGLKLKGLSHLLGQELLVTPLHYKLVSPCLQDVMMSTSSVHR